MRQGTAQDVTEFVFSRPSTAGVQPTPKSSLLPSETPLEEIKFSFASDYQLDIASGLGTGTCVCFFQL